MQVCLLQKNATNLSPLSFLSLSIVCDSQPPPIPATYLKFRLGLTNHHISLRSKRFLLVSEQTKTEAQDFRSEGGVDRENVAEKVNSRSFNLHRDYFKMPVSDVVLLPC